MHCEGPGVADWFKESTITTRNLYSFSLLKCSRCSLEREVCWDRVRPQSAAVSKLWLLQMQTRGAHLRTDQSGVLSVFWGFDMD